MDEVIERRLNPIYVTDVENGKKYALDFTRESVKWAEARKFDIEEAMKYPTTGFEDLFYYAFRAHHRDVPREKTDKLMAKWGGLPESAARRLALLYEQARAYNTIQTDEDAAKNPLVTLEMEDL